MPSISRMLIKAITSLKQPFDFLPNIGPIDESSDERPLPFKLFDLLLIVNGPHSKCTL